MLINIFLEAGVTIFGRKVQDDRWSCQLEAEFGKQVATAFNCGHGRNEHGLNKLDTFIGQIPAGKRFILKWDFTFWKPKQGLSN